MLVFWPSSALILDKIGSGCDATQFLQGHSMQHQGAGCKALNVFGGRHTIWTPASFALEAIWNVKCDPWPSKNTMTGFGLFDKYFKKHPQTTLQKRNLPSPTFCYIIRALLWPTNHPWFHHPFPFINNVRRKIFSWSVSAKRTVYIVFPLLGTRYCAFLHPCGRSILCFGVQV